MKKMVFGIIVILVLIAIIFFVVKLKSNSEVSDDKPVPTSTGMMQNDTNGCTNNDIDTSMETEGAAGSVYAKLVITNISDKPCDIYLGNYIDANFEGNNISTNYKETGPEGEIYNLLPGKSVYSQIHYPNGPQCSEISPTTVVFSYNTVNNSVAFKTADAKDSLTVRACKSEEEKTVIDIWPIQDTPING